MSVLLHSVNTVAFTATLRDYDGGPSEAESEKRKSTCHILVAEQLH